MGVWRPENKLRPRRRRTRTHGSSSCSSNTTGQQQAQELEGRQQQHCQQQQHSHQQQALHGAAQVCCCCCVGGRRETQGFGIPPFLSLSLSLSRFPGIPAVLVQLLLMLCCCIACSSVAFLLCKIVLHALVPDARSPLHSVARTAGTTVTMGWAGAAGGARFQPRGGALPGGSEEVRHLSLFEQGKRVQSHSPLPPLDLNRALCGFTTCRPTGHGLLRQGKGAMGRFSRERPRDGPAQHLQP